ncbi:archease [Candidatus Micrarchaeota archaeon]|nr:MAG: archease [Candidatus Micrarchaeota archaeon]
MFETFEHKADIGVRGIGKTIEEAFEEAAKAMFSIMFDINCIEKKEKVTLKCNGDDLEMLLVEWLNTLLAEADLRGLAFSEFRAKIEQNSLKGEAYGEKLNVKKHKAKTEVKAATYSNLKVYEDNGRWIAECIVDV